MRLSDKTIKLLKNFSSINQSILFKEGSKLRTISVMKNILAEATVDEEFPKDFGIYDLVQFLNGLDLHETPELDFTRDEHVVIKEGKMRSKYFFADPSVIISPPDKPLSLPTQDVCFVLKSQQLEKLKKASYVYALPDISAIGENGVVKLEMAGSCSGCAMSQKTLHEGVERMLKHYVPEVQEVRPVDA